MKISYEQTIDDFKVDPSTGEILDHQQTKDIKVIANTKTQNEPDYVKIYKYVNTLFAAKGIKQSLTPFIIEISNHMTYARDGQIVNLNKITKSLIAENTGVSIKRLDQVIAELRKSDVLRKIQNGVYGVNPYICARGSWSDIKKLQVHYDFVSGELTTTTENIDKITGEEIKKIITNKKNGQFSLSTNEDE